jgi:mono/diheme cytochrome c family protein
MKLTFLLSAMLFSTLAQAGTPAQELDRLVREAGSPASVARGEQLFRTRHSSGEAESCTSCHTSDARKPGSHFRTRKEIAALAPSANAERFTDTAKVEKWFKRNCKEVLGRLCSAQEKADFTAYMISVR